MADRVPLEFDPPVRELRALLLGVDDEELTGPSPCQDWAVAALLDHLMALSVAFAQAGRKRAEAPGTAEAPPEPSVAHLSPHWRSRLPVLLEDLANAWNVPDAWTGTAKAGGVTMPASEMGTVAMGELILHSWDLARATGQEYAADPRTLEALVELFSQYPPEGTAGMFGPAVPTDSEAGLMEQVIGLAGRDPAWRARRHSAIVQRPREAA